MTAQCPKTLVLRLWPELTWTHVGGGERRPQHRPMHEAVDFPAFLPRPACGLGCRTRCSKLLQRGCLAAAPPVDASKSETAPHPPLRPKPARAVSSRWPELAPLTLGAGALAVASAPPLFKGYGSVFSALFGDSAVSRFRELPDRRAAQAGHRECRGRQRRRGAARPPGCLKPPHEISRGRSSAARSLLLFGLGALAGVKLKGERGQRAGAAPRLRLCEDHQLRQHFGAPPRLHGRGGTGGDLLLGGKNGGGAFLRLFGFFACEVFAARLLEEPQAGPERHPKKAQPLLCF